MLGVAVTIVTAALVTSFFLQNIIRQKYKEAAKAIIKSKDTSVLYVNVYDKNDKMIQELEIKSETGIDSTLFKGQIIKV